MTRPPLKLKKDEDRRLRAGHLWVYSNEVDTGATPLSDFEPGQQVEIQDARGQRLGSGYVNPHSLICARIVSRRGAPLDARLIRERVGLALALRQRLYPDAPYYRLVYGEADGLPGLVVDRYDGLLVAQITTAGMERVRDDLVEVLTEVAPALLLRNDTLARGLEGLPEYVEVAAGDVAEVVPVVENGVRFEVPLGSGQKTGWFFDHRENRARLRRYVPGARVLDLFSYAGGWGVQAAVAGAREVVCVDSSTTALAAAERSAALNGVAVRTIQGDVFEVLRELRGERFDVVVVDPPAFIKRKKDSRSGQEAYQRVNRLAMEVLGDGGILASASCSHHLSRDELRGAMLRASREARRDVQLLEEGGQAPDHPVHPAIPETSYLKAFFARVL